MNEEIKALVDHSIDSDQKLLHFTDQIFTSNLRQSTSTQTDLDGPNVLKKLMIKH